jgi:hypothetical protein
MSVSVPEDWILAGATLEIELPRNLQCATCGGGGCDTCERSGAVSIRGRKDPVELVEVTLPKVASPAGDAPSSSARKVVMRIPERGGVATVDASLPRGNLLLSVCAGAEAARGVTRLTGPSVPPPPMPEILSPVPVPAPAGGSATRWIVAAIVVVLVLWALLHR